MPYCSKSCRADLTLDDSEACRTLKDSNMKEGIKRWGCGTILSVATTATAAPCGLVAPDGVVKITCLSFESTCSLRNQRCNRIVGQRRVSELRSDPRAEKGVYFDTVDTQENQKIACGRRANPLCFSKQCHSSFTSITGDFRDDVVSRREPWQMRT